MAPRTLEGRLDHSPRGININSEALSSLRKDACAKSTLDSGGRRMRRTRVARRRSTAEMGRGRCTVHRRRIFSGQMPWFGRRKRMRLIKPRRPTAWSIAVLEIEIVVARHITRLFGPLNFLEVLLNYAILNHFAAERIDRVCDVGVKLGATLCVFRSARVGKPLAALIAVQRAQMVLHAAPRAVRSQLAARHRDERTIGPVDDLKVPHDEAIVKCDGTEGLEPFARFFHELDANLGDFHGRSPCDTRAT